MSITGAIKLFDKSKCLAKDGSVVVASSGSSSAAFALSMNRYIRWDSVGSNDATTETLTITFPVATTFSRLFIVDTNIKDFRVFYNTNQNFTNVTTVDGTATEIDIVNNTHDTAYFEFDQVTANNIVIEMDNTQIANQDKYITLVAVTQEIGTFEGFPKFTQRTTANEKRAQTQSGKYITQKGFEIFSGKLTVEYSVQADIDLMNDIFETQDPFLIWPCGGKFGNTNFSVDFKNWRLKDLYQVQTFGRIETNFRENIYTSSPFTSIDMIEEV